MSARSRRHAVGSGVAQVDRRERAVGELADLLLGADLGLAVGGDRVERGLLGEVAVCAGAIQAARRREHVAPDADLLGGPGQADRGVEVDVVGEVGVEIAQRIVGQRAEVDDRVEAAQVIGGDVAEIDVEGGDLVGRGPEVAVVEVAGVEADDLDALPAKQRNELDADVTAMTRDQRAHDVHYNRILRPWKASAQPVGALHSMARSRSMASKVSARNQPLPAWVA